ncbi:hypothetical protein BV898_06029 [Hypsibius exemplaris]|uniref:Uncharacterized protein n=1 Tax=Hypsibius exemplaris TaxID=2072580 RepID=A0A1W0WXT4_HYPEX|nr:hypothetical protein BV898_06029 [Hypsibius exemplaris]
MITMVSVKLLHFEREDLEGFPRLESLRLDAVRISVLDKFMFQSLVPAGTPSMLSDLQISSGGIKSMDWDFLRPIAGSLENLKLEALHLAANRWNCSEETFKLEQTSTVSLRNNNLQTIPRCFLDSLSAAALESLHLQTSMTAFCATYTKCDCCDLNSLAFWLQNGGHYGVIRSIKCGVKMTTFNYFPGQLNFPRVCHGPETTTDSPPTHIATFTQPSAGHSVANASVEYESDDDILATGLDLASLLAAANCKNMRIFSMGQDILLRGGVLNRSAGQEGPDHSEILKSTEALYKRLTFTVMLLVYSSTVAPFTSSEHEEGVPIKSSAVLWFSKQCTLCRKEPLLLAQTSAILRSAKIRPNLQRPHRS